MASISQATQFEIDFIKKIQKKIPPIVLKRKYRYVNVGWDDCMRARNSSIGPNIADWSFKLKKSGKILPFIRGPNYEDKTLTIRAKNLAIIVANKRNNEELETISFQNYLNNYGKYTPGIPDEVNLSSSQDEMVTVRFIVVICPEDIHGTCELVPTAYNYQTTDKNDPKNFIGASFHMGVGSRTDGTKTENVYLVKKNNTRGTYHNTWFRLTNENKETKEQKTSVASFLGTQSTGVGRNRVQCFQIPRKQKNKVQMRGSSSNSIVRPCLYRGGDVSKANVSHGSNAGEYKTVNGISYERDKSQNVTVTLAYYYSVRNPSQMNERDINHILDTLDKSYKDAKAQWIGSLVTGDGVDNFKEKKPIVELPVISEEDYLTYNQKVTQFPKDMKSFMTFPS